jgi:hypothetical protein
MTRLAWDKVGERRYETGVDRGVLFIPNNLGSYVNGYAWNGLTSVTESPSGAESNKQYADNQVYLNLVSAEEFGGTIEAFTYPSQFEQCDGTATPTAGVAVGQQARKSFGLAYRTRVGNDLSGVDYGYKIHLIYNCLAAPTEKAFATINDSPEAITFSWELSTTPVDPETNGTDGKPLRPTAQLTIDSTKVDATALANLENLIYGTAGTDPSLPTPKAVLAMFAGTTLEATPVQPTYNSTTKVITVPTTTGIDYTINGEVVTGTVTISADTIVKAVAKSGYKFPPVTDEDWLFKFA